MNKDLRDINTLQEWDKNARTIDEKGFERLKRQLIKLGVYKPLIIQADGKVLGGNMRLRAMRDLVVMTADDLQTYITDNFKTHEIVFINKRYQVEGQTMESGTCVAILEELKNPWVSIVEPANDSERMEYNLSDNDRAGKYEAEDLDALLSGLEIDPNLYSIDINLPKTIQELSEEIAPDAPATDITYQVVVVCKSDQDQLEFLNRVNEEGRKAKAKTLIKRNH